MLHVPEGHLLCACCRSHCTPWVIIPEKSSRRVKWWHRNSPGAQGVPYECGAGICWGCVSINRTLPSHYPTAVLPSFVLLVIFQKGGIFLSPNSLVSCHYLYLLKYDRMETVRAYFCVLVQKEVFLLRGLGRLWKVLEMLSFHVCLLIPLKCAVPSTHAAQDLSAVL